MPGPIDLLPGTDSALGRFDPRWKLAALLTAGCCLLALRCVATAALALTGAVLLAVLARLPWRWCLARLGVVLLVLTPFVVLLPFVQDRAEPAWQLGPLRFSPAGVWLGLRLLLNSFALALLVLVLLATAPLPTTFRAAQSLHAPGLLVQLGELIYRYVFVLVGELNRLRVALRVRGYRNRPTLHSYRTIGHVAGTLLVRSYEQAERVEQAMRCRGYDGRFRTLHDFRTRRSDVLGFLLIVAVAGVLVIADLAWNRYLRTQTRMTVPAIRVAGLTYHYPGGIRALAGVSLEVPAAERVGLVGPNGAGKTTLFLCLAGVLRSPAGTVRVAGLDPSDPVQRRRLPGKVGIIFQNSDDQLFNSTVFDDVAFGPLNLELPAEEVRRRVADALQCVGLAEHGQRVPFHLSGGEKRRVALAGVLAMQPEVLLLDEPSMHLDPRGRRELIRLIVQLSVTQLIASHDLEMVLETCGRAVVIDQGKVAAEGPTRELLADAALMEAHGLEVPYSLRGKN